MVGFGGGAIGRLERGNQRIYASQLFRIGEATGVGVDYFYVGLDGKAGESESVKADIDYLIKSLETAKGGDLRGDVKIVAELLAAELASDMVGDISDISQNPQDRKKDPEED